MHGKKLLFLAGAVILVLATAGSALAVGDAPYNRPNPLMDYVPQERAIYDTRYDLLEEEDCRACHGNSMADRHHYTNIVLIYNRCVDCHAIIDEAPGVQVISDCTNSNCHSWDDVGEMDDSGSPPNGWHHATNYSDSENCTVCHGGGVVAEILPDVVSFSSYPPTVVTPTPYSCENCHWNQGFIAAADRTLIPNGIDPLNDPEDAGHPSTYNHFDRWGNPIGYFEYALDTASGVIPKDILQNYDTHHMGIKGNVASECFKCHANDINDPDWDPTNEELIRYCQICHDINSLHRIFEHVGPVGGDGTQLAVKGWDAVGFHVPGATDPPVVYRRFEANEQCFGCHGGAVPTIVLDTMVAPVITAMDPMAGCPGAHVSLTGTDFDPENIGVIPGREVQFKISGTWTSVPIYSWIDTEVVFEVPGWVMPPGNYKVRVYDQNRDPTFKWSNQVIFTLKDCNSPQTIVRSEGPCDTVKVVLSNPTGVGFGGAQDTISAPGANDGVYRTIMISTSQGEYIPTQITNWANTAVQFRFKNFFEDLDGDYIQGAGDVNLPWCNTLELGAWNVFIRYIFYTDVDNSDSYTDGDFIHQIESSNPLVYVLTDDLNITKLNPKAAPADTVIKIIGINFGATQDGGEVRLGTKPQYNNGALTKGKVQKRIRLWSNTKIKFKLKVPAAWYPILKKRYVWVVKAGEVSDKKYVDIQ